MMLLMIVVATITGFIAGGASLFGFSFFGALIGGLTGFAFSCVAASVLATLIDIRDSLRAGR
jgi:hypothetical protein